MNQQNEHNLSESGIDTAKAEALMHERLSRRKFLTRTGIASLPVVLSVQSGSAWGCVDLACKPGDASLSNSASGVASATAAHPNQFISPKWSSLSTVQDVLVSDFDKYLKSPYKYTICTRSGNNYTIVNKSNCLTWWNTVKNTSNALYIKNGTGRNATHSLYQYDRTVPAFKDYLTLSGLMLDSLTKFNSIFTGGSSTTFGSLLSLKADTLETYLAAAYIAAIWERHPVYIKKYPGRDLCYPKPEDFINIYTSRFTRDNGENDLFGLLKLYTPKW